MAFFTVLAVQDASTAQEAQRLADHGTSATAAGAQVHLRAERDKGGATHITVDGVRAHVPSAPPDGVVLEGVRRTEVPAEGRVEGWTAPSPETGYAGSFPVHEVSAGGEVSAMADSDMAYWLDPSHSSPTIPAVVVGMVGGAVLLWFVMRRRPRR